MHSCMADRIANPGCTSTLQYELADMNKRFADQNRRTLDTFTVRALMRIADDNHRKKVDG